MANKVAIVTGGARGIGFACARRLLDDGYNVVIADVDEGAGRIALEGLEAHAAHLHFVHCNVGDKLSVHNLIAETLSRFGSIDVLLNNAGIAFQGGILDLSPDDFDRVLNVNLKGAFLVSRAVVDYMVSEIENRDDRSRLTDKPYSIINMSSINDQVALPDYLAYNVSKGGLLQMTKSMALQLAPYGIRVNAVGPGSIKTEMLSSVAGSGKAFDKILMRTPMGRPGLPDEIASVVAFLASEDASYITGQCIYADGGRLALNYIMPLEGAED